MTSINLNACNFTQIPNYILDVLPTNISLPELAILLQICRKTFGWRNPDGTQKAQDTISLSQFEKITGLSRPTIIEAISNLVKKNIIKKFVEGLNGQQKVSYGLGEFYEHDLQKVVLMNEEEKRRKNQNIFTSANTALPPSKAILPPTSKVDLPAPSKAILPTKERELNKKESSSSKSSSSFFEKADDAKKAVVKAPAQRTLPPEPVAKPVASASLPSQPASCSKSSVADAPLADELSFSKKFREKYPEDVFNEKAFKQAYNQMKGKKDVNVPLAYVKTIYDRVKQELEASEKLAPLVAYHRKLAETALDRNMGMGSGGCYFIEGDSYVHQSGTGTKAYKFDDIENPIWTTLKYILKL